MKPLTLITLLVFCLASSNAPGQTVKDRKAAILGDRSRMEGNTRWIYNDIEEGFEVARQSGKPLMVVLRCVPCLGCMGIDTGVLMENPSLTPLMDQFVRVRVIDANSLDLSLFQFDYDLSFSTLFFNGDGTVYGRYGSWSHQEDSLNKATASFERANDRERTDRTPHPGPPPRRKSPGHHPPKGKEAPPEDPHPVSKRRLDTNGCGILHS